MQSDTYEKIVECLNDDVRLVVDAEKDLLLRILKYKPFLIKPNNIELGDMFGVKLNSDEEIVCYAKGCRKKEQGMFLFPWQRMGLFLWMKKAMLQNRVLPKVQLSILSVREIPWLPVSLQDICRQKTMLMP